MQQFYEAFLFTLLHSLWQSAVLYCCYAMAAKYFHQFGALAKRNALLIIIQGQFILSIFTFIIHWSNVGLIEFEYKMPDQLTPLSSEAAVCFFYGYLLLFFVQIVAASKQWRQFNQLNYQEKIPAPLWLQHFLNSQSVNLAINQHVTVWLNNTISTPMVFGFFKPVILVPASLISQLSPLQIEALVMHELFHVKHHDFIFNIAVIIIKPLFWFNPWVKKACAELCLQREMACDAAVITGCYEVQLYASSLLGVARNVKKNQPFLMAAVSEKKALLERIQYFSGNILHHRGVSQSVCFGSIILGFCLVITTVIFTKTEAAEIKTATTATNKILNIPQATLDEVMISIATTSVNTKSSKPLKRQKHFLNDRKLIQAAPNNYTAEDDELVSSINEYAVSTAYTIEDSARLSETSVLFNEESAGQTTTIAYTLTVKDGKILAKPIWMIKETLPPGDSLRRKDTVPLRIIPNVQ